MEEAIGYEGFFSAEEWDAIDTSEFDALDEALELEFGTSPDGPDEPHVVVIHDHSERTHARFEIECERCGDIGTADQADLADTIKRLHETFVAKLVDAWSVDR